LKDRDKIVRETGRKRERKGGMKGGRKNKGRKEGRRNEGRKEDRKKRKGEESNDFKQIDTMLTESPPQCQILIAVFGIQIYTLRISEMMEF
jgi:hypothetical protein